MGYEEWSEKVADLSVDMLVERGLIQRVDFGIASKIIAKEIFVRLAMDDHPSKTAAESPDKIHIASLVLNVHIGVTDRERAESQRLTVSLTLRPARGFAGLQDRIGNTLNYSAVCATVRALAATAAPRRLIETFAEDIAAAVLAGFPLCAEVDVELRKYVLVDTDYVAVRLTRRQP